MQSHLISVIIPVYNVEKYLKKCLDSVLQQTYKNLEIICVNDGSTDNSLAILKEFRRKDSRIIILDQENKGQGIARNEALKYSQADYVSFIDSDDYIDPCYIESLYNKLKESDSDFVVCGMLPVGDNTKEKSEYSLAYQYKMKCLDDFPINPNRVWPAPWAKLYRMDIIKQFNLRFPEGLVNEDNYWNFMYCAYSKKYAVIHEKLYFHRLDNPDSTMKKTIYRTEHCYDIVKVCCQIFDSLLNSYNFEFYHNCLDNFFFDQVKWIIQLHKKPSIDKVFYAEIEQYLMRSKSAKQRFETSDLFKMLEREDISQNVKMKKNPLISVVIPVYNVEKYLKRCLDSVLRQTYKNLEIICVNDGSTDNSASILEEFQQKDSRINVIHQENGGLSSARNMGLNYVTADYITFIDSDDYVDPRYVEVLYNRLYEENADFSVCDILPFGKDAEKNIQYTYWIKKKMEGCSSFPINPNKLVMMAWGKLFKMDIIRDHQLQFPEGLVCEDNYWHYLYCSFSKRYTIAYEKLYFYRWDNPDSIMKKTIYQTEHCYDIMKIACRIFDSLKDANNCNFYRNCCDDFFWTHLEYLMTLHKKTSIDKVFWNEIKEYLVRSKKAREKFENSRYFKMLESDI